MDYFSGRIRIRAKYKRNQFTTLKGRKKREEEEEGRRRRSRERKKRGKK